MLFREYLTEASSLTDLCINRQGAYKQLQISCWTIWDFVTAKYKSRYSFTELFAKILYKSNGKEVKCISHSISMVVSFWDVFLSAAGRDICTLNVLIYNPIKNQQYKNNAEEYKLRQNSCIVTHFKMSAEYF